MTTSRIENGTNGIIQLEHGGEEDEYTPLLKSRNGRDTTRERRYGVVECDGSCERQIDEEAARESMRSDKVPTPEPVGSIAGVISILLIGVFIANADGSLVLATSGTISSEFDDLGNAGWLITSYTLAMCATQSLYGKLSDIYGRKATIVASYVFFAVGCAICGLGQTLEQVILGRVLAGVGGAGIHCLVSIVIADMCPIREVAAWRSYANIAATTGRSLGGPIGGYLTDTIGWRMSFLCQCPPTLLALGLVAWKLQVPFNQERSTQSQLGKLKRIDFFGAIFMSLAIVGALMVLDLGGQRMPWTDPTMLRLLGGALASLQIFFLIEGFWAKEPIFPLRLMLNRDVITSYINLGFQTGAQGAMMMLVPIYFQVSAHATLTNAGMHLTPSVIGNAVGGLITGYVIKRTGKYKPLSILGALASTTCYTLLLLTWHGHTTPLESLFIIPGGFGNGIALSAAFIALTAGIETEQMAIASSGLYLSSNIGMVAGLSVATSVLQSTLRKELRISLEGTDGRDEIIMRALTDIEFVRGLKGRIGEVVTRVYVRCLAYTHGVSLVGSVVALIAAMCIKEHEL